MDDSWADIFVDDQARTVEHSDSDPEDSTYSPGMQVSDNLSDWKVGW